MTCIKCGSQVTKYVTGISNKPGKNFGKPWAAYKCQDCAEMNWVKTQPGQGGQGAAAPSNAGGAQLGNIAADVKKILNILAEVYPDATEAQGVAVEAHRNTTPF